MKICYDPETDILTMTLTDRPVADSDELRPGTIVDFNPASA